MAETIEEVKSVKRSHIFHCDECQKFIGRSIEHDDGYYEPHGFGLPIINLMSDAGVITLASYSSESKNKLLCRECYDKKVELFKQALTLAGFVKVNEEDFE